MAAALQKVKINDKTECTGFFVINTDTALTCNNKIKIKCKVCIIKRRLLIDFSEWCDSNTWPSIPKTDTLPAALHSVYKYKLNESETWTHNKRIMIPLLYLLSYIVKFIIKDTVVYGDNRIWTDNLMLAKHTLYQLRYDPRSTRTYFLKKLK